MKLLILLMASLVAGAVPVISNASMGNITAHGARFNWTTDVAATTKIKIDIVDPPVATAPVINQTNSTTHVWFASGLIPGTTYYYQLCSSDGVETCTATANFPTLAAASGIATPPTAPTTVDVTPSGITGFTYPVDATCSNLQTQLDAALAADGMLTHQVVIPAGVTCVGQYVLNVKSGVNPTGVGKIYLTTDTTLPPDGVRVTPTTAANFAVIMSNYLWPYYQTTPPGGCIPGDMWVDSDAVSDWVNYCTSSGVYTPQTSTSGAGPVSGACTSNAWYRDTLVVDLRLALYWCTGTQWRKVTMGATNNVVDWAGLYTAANAKHWWIKGITIQDIERPTEYTDLLSRTSGSGDERGITSFCLAYTVSTSQYIFFDRVYFNGQGFPHRQQEALCVADGSYQAMMNSYAANMNRWRPVGASESASHVLFFLNGAGPWWIDNNYFLNTSGMSIFNSDDNPVGQTNDVTITNNTFFMDTTLNYSEPVDLGVYFYFRHHVELKRGQRWNIKGNTFVGGFPSGNPNGASIGLTPTNGSPTALQCRTNTLQISDVNIESNTFKYVPMVLLATAHGASPNCNTNGGIRLRYYNNVTYTTGKSSTGNQNGLSGYTFNGQHNEVGLGWEDLIFDNNTHIEPTSAGSNAHMFNFGGDWQTIPNARVSIRSNIYFSTAIGYQWSLGISGSGIYGTAALDQMVEPNSTYSYAGNARQRGQTGGLDNTAAFPSGNYSSQLAADFSPFFVQCSICGEAGPYRPSYTSKFQGTTGTAKGYNGVTSGPDLNKLDADSSVTINPRVIGRPTTTTITFGWFAPNTTACSVGLSQSSDYSNETRVTYGGAANRAQTLTRTGLTPNTLYYYRIYCRDTYEGSVRTR